MNLPKGTIYACADCGLQTEEQAALTLHLADRPGSCAWQRMTQEVAKWNPEYRTEDPETYDLAIWEQELAERGK